MKSYEGDKAIRIEREGNDVRVPQSFCADVIQLPQLRSGQTCNLYVSDSCLK